MTFKCQFVSTQLLFMLLMTRKYSRWTKTLCRKWINYIIGYFLVFGKPLVDQFYVVGIVQCLQCFVLTL